MAKKKFKTGDQVMLNSGMGPIMVVKEYEPKDGVEVICQWFDKNENLQEKAFYQDTLTKYTGPFIA